MGLACSVVQSSHPWVEMLLPTFYLGLIAMKRSLLEEVVEVKQYNHHHHMFHRVDVAVDLVVLHSTARASRFLSNREKHI